MNNNLPGYFFCLRRLVGDDPFWRRSVLEHSGQADLDLDRDLDLDPDLDYSVDLERLTGRPKLTDNENGQFFQKKFFAKIAVLAVI